MNWTSATDIELHIIAYDDQEATYWDRWDAMMEIVRRAQQKRRPYRNNQMKVKAAMPRW